ncbi:Peroxidase superfamily protein [Prunus dulcis]|uniref:peroxidase n=1 Tax=Prunus dulcis TaxID=3755 RepID=A0A5H2XVS3_PRUDU|nr:Peroxidase superfamily protein [Prunus dulcis]
MKGGESERAFLSFSSHEPLVKVVSLASADGGQDFFMEMTDSAATNIEYDFYRDTCPEAETIVRSTMAQIYSQHKNVSAQLLRLFFHDCFIQAVPNNLKDLIKLIRSRRCSKMFCPAAVSCADILALATRDGVVLCRSYYDEAMAEIPKPDDNITQTLHLFSLRGFTDRETVSLLGGTTLGRLDVSSFSLAFTTSRGQGNQTQLFLLVSSMR